MQVNAKAQIALLIVLAALCVWALRPDVQPAWGQSPIPPMFIPSFQPTSQTSPLWSPIETTVQNRFDAPFWTSPWMWFGTGLVLFGGIAVGLVQMLKKSDSAHDEP
ncbi:MAG: hypothetical protein JW934_10840 [Anaerolineae bacterium]|nr:hypothetical protein [Anaerolineae bacterium]